VKFEIPSVPCASRVSHLYYWVPIPSSEVDYVAELEVLASDRGLENGPTVATPNQVRR
jgi:hypothetical protein